MHNLPTNNETDIIKNIFNRSLNEDARERVSGALARGRDAAGEALDRVVGAVSKLPQPFQPDYTRNTDPRLAPQPNYGPMVQQPKPFVTPAGVGAVEVGTGLLAKHAAQQMGVQNPWALTGIEAGGQVLGGRMMGASPSIPGALGGVGLMNLTAPYGAQGGGALARSLGAEPGSAAELAGIVTGSIGTAIPSYMAGQRIGQAIGSGAEALGTKLLNSKGGQALLAGLQRAVPAGLRSGALGAGLRGLARTAGVAGAMYTAAETGWELGRLFGDNMSIDPLTGEVRWLSGKGATPQDRSARLETKEMSALDLAKETLGYGKAGRAAEQARAEKEWNEGEKAKQARAVYDAVQAQRDIAQTERRTGQLSQQTVASLSKDLKERGEEAFKATYKNDPQVMKWLESQQQPQPQPQTEGYEMELREHYYNHLMATLLSEEQGVNFGAYNPTRKAHRKARLYQKQLKTRPEMNWSGDSATVEDLPAEPSSTGGSISPESFVKNAVIDLMTNAQTKGIRMTHGQAHKMALDMLKKHMGQ